MSGVEAVGFVLGILPLLISAAEHYDDVFEPFKRYQKFAPELENYQKQLGTQKTTFRNECQWLLATLIGRQTAREMLKDRTHVSWDDSELDEKFSRQLGESGAACKTIIDLIQTKLKVIEEETESFGLVIQQSIPTSSIGDKAWRSRVRKKLKFSFSESRLEKSLKGLRNLNHDFRILAAQTTRLDNQHQNLSTPILAPVDKKLEESRMVQKASSQLYGALARACQIHDEHSAHFRLESQHVSIENTGSSLVRFNIAFAHRPGGTSALLEPVWLAVDSTFDETERKPLENEARHNAQQSLKDLSNHLKRNISPPCQSSVKKIKGKSVRFATPAPSPAISSKATLVTSFIATSALPDFCVQHDFCKQLQRCGSARTPENKYLGYLEKSGTCKHLVYFAPPITTCSSQQPISLAQIVTSVSQNPKADHFLQYERLRLARQLASAVLQFHATPLLKRTWRSDDVVFFGESASNGSITSPHLNVQVGKPGTNKDSLLESNALSSENIGFIRNPYLFGLGVTLIELAYQAPIRSLRQDRDLTNGQESKHTDFFVADRLSKTMGTSLGVNYAKVVRKCLGCDFGEGTTDLNDPGLQAVFYKDVVCELERLERAFVMLQLAA